MVLVLNLRRDFSRFPGGRFRSDGPHSGQEFREDVLEPALRTHDKVVVELDGVAGLPVSFLEEAFGGLVRSGYNQPDLSRRLQIEANNPRFKVSIR